MLTLPVLPLSFLKCAAALAEDHFNDVISNAAAMVTAAIAFHTPYWWFDPIGESGIYSL